jgi:hypothetical protein
MKNTFRPLLAVSTVLVLSIGMFAFANENHKTTNKIFVEENKDFNDLTSNKITFESTGWALAWSSEVSGIIAWDPAPAPTPTPTPTPTKPKKVN